MRTLGLIISHKENEYRRALIPADVANIAHKDCVLVEAGYGDKIGYSDEEYRAAGVKVVSREEVLQADVLCDPKIGDADYFDQMHAGQVAFGWIHAVQNRDITDEFLSHKLTGVAWEDMFLDGRHVFWKNNEIAGEAAVMHAYCLHGIFPYDTKVAILGNGNVARGAYRILVSLGADVTCYNRHTEQLLRKEIGDYDVIVNAILWDTSRKDHIIYREDLKRMKRNALIIDISCDRNGGIESSIPTTLDDPTYVVNGVTHYVVDHTPSLFYKTVSKSLSEACSKYFDALIEDNLDDVLQRALIIKDGVIVDERINKFQHR